MAEPDENQSLPRSRWPQWATAPGRLAGRLIAPVQSTLAPGAWAWLVWLAGSGAWTAQWWPARLDPWWLLTGVAVQLTWSVTVMGHHHHRKARMAALGQALDTLASRLFDHRLPVEGRDAFADLAIRFNAAAEALTHHVTEVVRATSSVARAGDEMSLAAQTLAIRTEDQANVIAQTTVAIEDVLASVRCTSDMASSVDVMSRQLCDQAASSEQVVANAAAAIQRIRHSTAEMTEALSVIDTLTFQTNILALNAAVEAARAGEAGRGFAVVASEVRALATRTADASKQIKTVIDRSNQEVASGVREVESVKAAINDIGQGFRDVSAQMCDVSGSNRAQSAAIGLISQGLDQLSALTRANTELVVESVSASERLRSGAQELHGVTARLEGAQDAGSGAAALVLPAHALVAAPEGIEFF